MNLAMVCHLTMSLEHPTGLAHAPHVMPQHVTCVPQHVTCVQQCNTTVTNVTSVTDHFCAVA